MGSYLEGTIDYYSFIIRQEGRWFYEVNFSNDKFNPNYIVVEENHMHRIFGEREHVFVETVCDIEELKKDDVVYAITGRHDYYSIEEEEKRKYSKVILVANVSNNPHWQKVQLQGVVAGEKGR